MKIFFRYLFVRLLVPFLIVLWACAIIWIMVDLYGNIYDFIEHKIKILFILRYYALLIPGILVQVLPATLLFATLWTLLSLNRRSEMVAFQSGGMSPLWLFSPFFLFALICTLVLGVDLSGPAAHAKVTQDRLLQQVKGADAKSNVFHNLPYVDRVYRRVWFFQRLDTNQNTAKGVEILLRDTQGNDLMKYFARDGKWNGEFWKLSGVKAITFAPDGSPQDQKTYEELDLPDITTSPSQLSLIVSQPEQLTVAELSQYIATSTTTPEHLASYRTEWWYRVLYPLSLVVLLLYALLLGTRTDRRSNAGVAVLFAILVLLFYTFCMFIFMTAGKNNRLPPFVSVVITEVIFGAIGLHLLAVKHGWWWQLWESWKRWQAPRDAAGKLDGRG